MLTAVERSRDWLAQAHHDLASARASAASGFHDWAAFAAQQAAEKAIKALYQARAEEAWGHSLVRLLDLLPGDVAPSADVRDAARRLDRHYVPSRYPNGFDSGAPKDYYSAKDSDEAIRDSEAILRWCDGLVTRP